MKMSGRFAVLGLLFAAPLVLAAQQPAAQDTARPRDPIATMLAHKSDLDLKADQVSKLEAIQKKLDGAAAPLRKQLEAFRANRPSQSQPGAFLNMTEAQRQQFIADRQKMRDAAVELRGLNRAAGAQAHAVLTTDQQTQLRQIMMRRGGRAGMRGGPGMRQGRGAWQGRGMRQGRGMGPGGAWQGRGNGPCGGAMGPGMRGPGAGPGFGPPGN